MSSWDIQLKQDVYEDECEKEAPKEGNVTLQLSDTETKYRHLCLVILSPLKNLWFRAQLTMNPPHPPCIFLMNLEDFMD